MAQPMPSGSFPPIPPRGGGIVILSVLVVGICQKTSAQGWGICKKTSARGGHLSILLEAVNAIPFSILNSLKNRPNFIPCGDLALPDFRELIKFWIQNDFQNNYKVKQRSLHAVETILKAMADYSRNLLFYSKV